MERERHGPAAPNGLTEFIFHHNNLGKKFIEALAGEIENDEYIRKIDAGNNRITEDPLKKLLLPAL